MKAEERARAVVKQINRYDGRLARLSGNDGYQESLIAAAIRSAENDALDRAIAECQRLEAEAFHCALAITAIKHKEP